MNIVDLVLALILLYGLVSGFFRGFLAELASLVAFVAGIYGAVYFSYILSDFLASRVSWNIQLVHLLAFAITFILIVFLISLAGKFLTTAVNLVALGIINKILGAGFGLIKIAFITSVFIMFLTAASEDINFVEEETLEQSKLYGPIKVMAPAIIPSILREVKELNFIKEEDTEPVIREI
ncbi:CvpA family protein [soil metagenome]